MTSPDASLLCSTLLKKIEVAILAVDQVLDRIEEDGVLLSTHVAIISDAAETIALAADALNDALVGEGDACTPTPPVSPIEQSTSDSNDKGTDTVPSPGSLQRS